jgi:chemotaxis signal transduction protein
MSGSDELGARPWVFFDVGGCSLAVPAPEVEEITPIGTTTPVPLAPARIRGLMSLRGEALPLLDLAVFLELASGPESKARTVLVCRTRHFRVGLLCRRALGIRNVEPKETRPPKTTEPASLRELARAELEGPTGVDVMLDLEAVLEASRVRG